jgi:predicted DNA-binding transcriptional regulator AlpA
MPEPITTFDDDPIVTQTEFAESIAHSPRTVQRWRTTGEGPAFVKLGKRIFYQRSAIHEWLRRRTVPNTRKRR